MITNAQFKKMALRLPEAVEQPHFENTSFRIQKKIFATLNEKEKRACVKFNEVDQSAFSAYDNTAIYAVPNKWGKQGWTLIELSKVKKEVLEDALKTSYRTVAPKKFVELLGA
jgi:predicted DNA-binding protein (MmcQ/YjbR family)